MLLHLFDTDLMRDITGMNEDSQQTLTSLANLRAASRTVQQHVDHQLADEEWKSSSTQRATEYCNSLAPGTALPEGQPRNVRLQALLARSAYHELCIGMQTFMIDAYAQEQFLRSLRDVLTPANPRGLSTDDPHQFRQKRAVACRTAGIRLFQTVARSLRFHHKHVHIAKLASEVLSFFLRMSVMSSPLRTFVIEALILAIQTHPLDSEIQRHCLTTLWSLTHSESQMTVGGHNMTQVVSDSMMATPPISDVTIVGLKLLARYIEDVFPMTQAAILLLNKCDVPVLEGLVLDTMQRLPLETGVARHGLVFLSILYDKCLCRTMQHERAAQYAVEAVVTTSGDHTVVAYAIKVLLFMIASCWLPPDGPAYSVRACTRLDATVLIPVLVVAVLAMPVTGPCKLICARLFELLFFLCQNHAVNAQIAVQHNAVLSLSERFSTRIASSADMIWTLHHNRLQALLLAHNPSVP